MPGDPDDHSSTADRSPLDGPVRTPANDEPPEAAPPLDAGVLADPTVAAADHTQHSPGTAVGVAASNMQAAGEAMTALATQGLEPDPFVGRILDDRYRITERLGEGGMGAVFVAEHLKLRKLVALKMIRAELAGNGEVAARFVREAMATAQFEHPHVASAIDFGTLPEGGAYLVMQLVRGQSLRDLLNRRGKLPWTTTCELLAQVADALSAARLAGIVHRDLKPENILVEAREDGSYLAKILDFGIAHIAPHRISAHAGAPETRALTRVGTVMGTPGYMSPEQAVGDRVDHRTDLYALGVVLWECIAGRALWDGPDVTSIISQQLREEVPTLRTVLSDASMPRELDALVQRLCARAASDRPEHAGAVRDELRALVHRGGSAWWTWRERAEQLWQLARTRFSALPPTWRALATAAAAACVLMLFALIAAEPAEPATTAQPPAAQAPTEDAQDSPSLAERAIELAQRVVTPEANSVDELPPELAEDAKTLMESARASDRRRAASNLLRSKPPERVPAYLRATAELEQARNCRDRKAAIGGISELKDARALPALRRLADAGRTGCGFLGLKDCYGCVRAELRRTIDALEATLTP